MTYRCCGGELSHKRSCFSTVRMLAGESVTYTAVVRHVVTVNERGLAYAQRYRWSCSCGKVGRWVSRRLQAQQGGATHQRRSR